MQAPSDRDFDLLVQFRQGLRGFLRWSEQTNEAVGSSQAIYQLLLVLRARRGAPIDINNAANALALRHHSAAELVKRAENAGLVERRADPNDRRRSLLMLTVRGASLVSDLAAVHIQELQRVYRDTFGVLEQLGAHPAEQASRQ